MTVISRANTKKRGIAKMSTHKINGILKNPSPTHRRQEKYQRTKTKRDTKQKTKKGAYKIISIITLNENGLIIPIKSRDCQIGF